MVTAVMVSAVVVPPGWAVLFAAAGQAPPSLSQVATVRRRERQSGIVNASAPETMLVATWVCAGVAVGTAVTRRSPHRPVLGF